MGRKRIKVHPEHLKKIAHSVSPIAFMDVKDTELARKLKIDYDKEYGAIMLHCMPMYDSINEAIEEIEANDLKF